MTPPLTIRRPANPLLPSRQRRPAKRMSLPIKRSTTWIIVTRQCSHQKAANDFFSSSPHIFTGTLFQNCYFIPFACNAFAMKHIFQGAASRNVFFKVLFLLTPASKLKKKLFPTKISLYSQYCSLAVDSDTDFLGILGL